MWGGAGSYGVCPEPGLYGSERGTKFAFKMKSGKLDCRNIAPTSRFREVPVGNRMMPAPRILSGTFHGAIATYSYAQKTPRSAQLSKPIASKTLTV